MTPEALLMESVPQGGDDLPLNKLVTLGAPAQREHWYHTQHSRLDQPVWLSSITNYNEEIYGFAIRVYIENQIIWRDHHYFIYFFYSLGAEAHLIALCAIISRVFCEESSCNYLYEVLSRCHIQYEGMLRYHKLWLRIWFKVKELIIPSDWSKIFNWNCQRDHISYI